jgi:cell division protein FtsN
VRVRVGPFATREAAEQARERLKAVGVESAVIAP